jgi:uncharacterized MnhB-related membrane protein
VRLPFTADQSFGVFREYNTAVWPVQVVLLLMALSALVTIWLRRRWSGVAVSAILSILWSWPDLGLLAAAAVAAALLFLPGPAPERK